MPKCARNSCVLLLMTNAAPVKGMTLLSVSCVLRRFTFGPPLILREFGPNVLLQFLRFSAAASTVNSADLLVMGASDERDVMLHESEAREGSCCTGRIPSPSGM